MVKRFTERFKDNKGAIVKSLVISAVGFAVLAGIKALSDEDEVTSVDAIYNDDGPVKIETVPLEDLSDNVEEQ